MLEAKGATKRFGDTAALEQLNLVVGAGEIVCMLGANGAGKTTTINLFLGFDFPDAGEVCIGGRAVGEDVEAARRQVAYIPDQVSLYPLLTGAENLRYFAKLAGRRIPQTDARELFVRAGLEIEAIDRRVQGYSKGMRQKVGIGVALAKQARALLLDEPLTGLDPVAANDFGVRLQEMRNDGAAILMATHDVFRARAIADRIGIMNRGRLVDIVPAKAMSPEDLDALYSRHMGR